jgi:diaminohydroxyphosphoribosylaminopyrimidine deaminase/5-amino-6-(5-phosphoribosylamino)uracil reductase
MRRALFLAERGRGRTSPNPVVGAVVVSPDGVVVGQGAHLELGGPHAEINALVAAGVRAQGSTLYCTLEPCVHHGRTGPCVERIVTAGVRRVVFALRDPNPRVDGRGAEYLRAHGVDVLEDVCGADAARQNAPFVTWIRDHRPLITIKTATSADGFVGRPGERVLLTGRDADRHFHRQRAAVDAIAVGSGTVLADDPLLTARGACRTSPLTRVIFDRRLRVSPSARVWSTIGEGPVIVVVSEAAVKSKPDGAAALRQRGATLIQEGTGGLRAVVRALAERGITWLLVEGGPTLHRAFTDEGLVDRVQWAVSPSALDDGLPMDHSAIAGLPAAAPRVTALGGDMLVEFDVHRAG